MFLQRAYPPRNLGGPGRVARHGGRSGAMGSTATKGVVRATPTRDVPITVLCSRASSRQLTRRVRFAQPLLPVLYDSQDSALSRSLLLPRASRRMAPQARLTFTPSASLAPPQPAPGLALSPVHHDRRLPSRSPTVDCIGAFSLRRCGGVKVGPVEVAVQRGTTIVQEAGNSRDGESLGELSWHGLDQAGTAGTWRLHLIKSVFPQFPTPLPHRGLIEVLPAALLKPTSRPSTAPSSCFRLPAPMLTLPPAYLLQTIPHLVTPTATP